MIYLFLGDLGSHALYLGMATVTVWMMFYAIFRTGYLGILIGKVEVRLFLMVVIFMALTGFYGSTTEYNFKIIGSYLLMFSPIFFYIYIERYTSYELKVSMVIVISLVFFLMLVKALVVLQEYPNGLRILASKRDMDIGMKFNFTGGGYPLAYSSALAAVFVLSLFRTLSIVKFRWLLLPLLITMVALVVEARSTTTLLAMSSGLILVFVIGRLRKQTIKLILPIVTVIGLLVIVLNADLLVNILVGIASLFGEDNVVSGRIGELAELMSSTKGFTSSQSFGVRQDLMLRSWGSFKDHPLMGVGHIVGYGIDEQRLYIGNHSEFFDLLARFGLFSLLVIFIYIKRIKVLKINLGAKVVLVFTFLLMMVFNPIMTFQINFTLFFIVPLFHHVVLNRRFQ